MRPAVEVLTQHHCVLGQALRSDSSDARAPALIRMLLGLLQMLNKNKRLEDKKCWLTLTWLSIWHYQAALAVDKVSSGVNSLISFSTTSRVEEEDEQSEAAAKLSD